jgi:hypothetical protein
MSLGSARRQAPPPNTAATDERRGRAELIRMYRKDRSRLSGMAFCGKETNGRPWKSTNALSARLSLNGFITN